MSATNPATTVTTGSVDLGSGRGKPSPSSGTWSYTTPGTYTVWMPVYKYISFWIAAAGGGQAGCGGGTYSCNPYSCCTYYYWQPYVGPVCGAVGTCYNTCTYTGYAGSAGGWSGVSYLIAGNPTSTSIGYSDGGGGGQPWPNATTGYNGGGTWYSPWNGYGSVSVGGGAAGGSSTSCGYQGGAGGAGGAIGITMQHAVSSGWIQWANTSGVTQFTVTVGQGGAGGAGSAGGYPAGANGANGAVYISFS